MRVSIEKDGEIIWAAHESDHVGGCIVDPSLSDNGMIDRIISSLESALESARHDKESYRNFDPSKIYEIPADGITYVSE